MRPRRRSLLPHAHLAAGLLHGAGLESGRIAFCRRTHNLVGVDFVHGDAEKLPFPDESFDAVINVESSGAYPHFSRFLAEVARVLRPGGHFLYADLRPRDKHREWEAALAAPRCACFRARTSMQQVLRGMENNTPRMLDLIGRMPTYLRHIGREFCGVKGTKFYRAMQSGEYSYRMYCFACHGRAVSCNSSHIASAQAI